MTELEKNEVKWTPAEAGALLDVSALQKHYAAKGAAGGGTRWGGRGAASPVDARRRVMLGRPGPPAHRRAPSSPSPPLSHPSLPPIGLQA
jgi:hypothetical protein